MITKLIDDWSSVLEERLAVTHDICLLPEQKMHMIQCLH